MYHHNQSTGEQQVITILSSNTLKLTLKMTLVLQSLYFDLKFQSIQSNKRQKNQLLMIVQCMQISTTNKENSSIIPYIKVFTTTIWIDEEKQIQTTIKDEEA